MYAPILMRLQHSNIVTGGEADDWLEQVTAYLTDNLEIPLSKKLKRRKLPITPLKPGSQFPVLD